MMLMVLQEERIVDALAVCSSVRYESHIGQIEEGKRKRFTYKRVRVFEEKHAAVW